MSVMSIINTLLPFIKKVDVYDLGCIVLLFSLGIAGKVNGLAATYPVSFSIIGGFILFVGRTRKVSSLDLTHLTRVGNPIEKESPYLKIYRVSELKTGSNSQISLEIILSNSFMWKASFIKYLVNQINFYLVLEYFPDQVTIRSDFESSDSKTNINAIKKISITDHMGKEIIQCPLTVIIKNYNENKKILIRFISEPRNKSKITSTIAYICSRTWFFAGKKELLIKAY